MGDGGWIEKGDREPGVRCGPYLDTSDAVPVLIVSLQFLVPFISTL